MFPAMIEKKCLNSFFWYSLDKGLTITPTAIIPLIEVSVGATGDIQTIGLSGNKAVIISFIRRVARSTIF